MKGQSSILMNSFNGKVIKYKDLPQCSKNSIDVYYREEYEIDIDADDLFMYAEIPMIELIKAIDVPIDLRKSIKTFDEYHKWYIDGGDIPSHEGIWALVFADEEDDIIEDGWHRFHSYVEKGIKTVPCIQRILSS